MYTMDQYVRIQSHTCSHTDIHTHMHAHTSCIRAHTYKHTATHMYTESHTQPHLHAHNHRYIYSHNTHTQVTHTSGTHSHKHMHTHTPPTYPGFGGPWSPLPVNPGTLGYLKVRGAYVRLITKPTGLGSGPRSRRGLSPSSLRSTHTSREKEGLQGSSQGWKWISQFPHTLRSQPRACKDVAPVSLTLVRWRVWRRLESRGRGSQGLPGVLGALEEVGFRVSAAV